MTAPVTRARRLLPLHDASVPVVCTIADDDKADRIELIVRLRAALTSLERTDTGLLLQLERSSSIDDDVRRFARDEKRCCRFWGFAVVEGDEEVVLRWDGPPGAAALLDTIEGVLRTDAPIDAISGLL